MPLTGFAVDDGPHNMDGLLLRASDGSQRDRGIHQQAGQESWVDPVEPDGRRRSLFRAQYNALGKLNLPTIERIVVSKYRRGAAYNRQHPFVDVLLSDITESEEARHVQTGARTAASLFPAGAPSLRGGRRSKL